MVQGVIVVFDAQIVDACALGAVFWSMPLTAFNLWPGGTGRKVVARGGASESAEIENLAFSRAGKGVSSLLVRVVYVSFKD